VPIRRFLAMWAILALVVGLTVVIDDRLDIGGGAGNQVVSGPDGTVAADGSSTSTTAAGGPGVVPGPGQVRVRGTLAAVHLEGAVLDPREVPVPLTIVAEAGFGNGGELTGVLVGGAPSTVVWDGGRPLVLSTGGALVLDPVTVDLVPEGLRVLLGGGVHGLLAGPYHLDTPVAVGSEGIATPHDTVDFEATSESRLEARGNAGLVLGPAPHRFLGPGRVHLEGVLERTDAAGTTTATSFDVDTAAFDLTFTPEAGGGWSVEGLVDTTSG
jgi:hypothetical protein